jgi:hypothetical protein
MRTAAKSALPFDAAAIPPNGQCSELVRGGRCRPVVLAGIALKTAWAKSGARGCVSAAGVRVLYYLFKPESSQRLYTSCYLRPLTS